MPDNRELAALIWLGIALAAALSHEKTRSSLGAAVRALLQPFILVSLLLLCAYIGLEVWLGFNLGLWSQPLLKGTIIWTAVSAVGLYMSTVAASGNTDLFRRTLAAAVGGVVFVEFFMNLFVMNIWGELVLQPLVAGLAIFAAVAGIREEHRSLKGVFEVLLGLLGLSLLAFAAWQLYANWSQLDRAQTIRELLLPIWLTVGLLPFLYIMSLYVAYDSAWRGISWATTDRRARWRARTALLTSFHARGRELRGFSWNWCRQLAQASSLKAARRVIKEFREQKAADERAVAEERARLQRLAGVDGTDADGLRLDRREFKETMDALIWLHTCQMGWHRGRGGRYRTELMDILASEFLRRGLPEDRGIILNVSSDGQFWYAWRRTITGWCFAIGAAGPPPDQWEFDGPEPPRGFPGKDPAWGDAPFSDVVNPNWR